VKSASIIGILVTMFLSITCWFSLLSWLLCIQ
jgi:hypothetical protein